MASAFRADSEAQTHPARERIVAAAIQVFGNFGFTKSTIQEIAATAHVSKPLYYRHFRNKQAVFEAAVDRVFSEWRGALVKRLEESSGGTKVALRVLFLGMLDYGRAHPFLNRLLTRDAQLLLSTQGDAWDRACLELQRLIEEILTEGIETGEVRSDLPVEHMADLLTEIHFAYANRQLLRGAIVELDFAASLGGFDHRQTDSVLHTVGGIGTLELRDDASRCSVGDASQFYQGGTTHEFGYIARDIHWSLLWIAAVVIAIERRLESISPAILTGRLPLP